MSRKHDGEKYVKSFGDYTHLLTMLYAVIQRFDSLREIEPSMTAEVRKLHHVGIDTVPKRSTLPDANAKRPEKFLRRSIATCMLRIETFFHRTADAMAQRNG